VVGAFSSIRHLRLDTCQCRRDLGKHDSASCSPPPGAIRCGVVSYLLEPAERRRRADSAFPGRLYLVTAISAIAFPCTANVVWAYRLPEAFTSSVSASADRAATVLQLSTPHAYRGALGAFYVLSTTVFAARWDRCFFAFRDRAPPARIPSAPGPMIAVVCAITSPIALSCFLCIGQFVRLTVQPADPAP